MVNFLDELEENFEIQNPKINQKSITLILQFLLNKNVLLNDEFDLDIKCAFISCITGVNHNYPTVFNMKKNNLGYLQATFSIYLEMLIKEEVKF